MLFIRRRTRGFTLIEVLVVMVIIGTLSVFAYAPYEQYSRTAKIQSSAMLVRQTMEKARVLATNWYVHGTTGNNAWIWVFLEQGADSLLVYASRSGTTWPASDSILVERVRLDAPTKISTVPNGKAFVSFAPPFWSGAVYQQSGVQSYTWLAITVGINAIQTGSLSKTFSFDIR